MIGTNVTGFVKNLEDYLDLCTCVFHWREGSKSTNSNAEVCADSFIDLNEGASALDTGKGKLFGGKTQSQ